MRNMIIEITNAKMDEAQREMGFTVEETLEMMAITNDITVEEVERRLHADDARQTELAIQAMKDEPFDPDLYEHEMRCENAWMTQAEYDPEAQDEMRRDDMMGGF